jgi:hypothetical protein
MPSVKILNYQILVYLNVMVSGFGNSGKKGGNKLKKKITKYRKHFNVNL